MSLRYETREVLDARCVVSRMTNDLADSPLQSPHLVGGHFQRNSISLRIWRMSLAWRTAK